MITVAGLLQVISCVEIMTDRHERNNKVETQKLCYVGYIQTGQDKVREWRSRSQVRVGTAGKDNPSNRVATQEL